MATATDPANSEDLDAAALYRLLSWLSPSYPVSAYSFSHGLEWAIEDQPLRDRAALHGWIVTVLTMGSGRNDAILLAAAWRAAGDGGALNACNDLALALAGSAERLEETRTQGRAFLATTEAAWPADTPKLDRQPAYPVAVGMMAAAHGIPLQPVLVGYLHAFAANLVSAGVRAIPLGQTDGQRLTADLAPAVAAVAAEAADATLDDIGGCSFIADIAAMAHETQQVRLFRS